MFCLVLMLYLIVLFLWIEECPPKCQSGGTNNVRHTLHMTTFQIKWISSVYWSFTQEVQMFLYNSIHMTAFPIIIILPAVSIIRHQLISLILVLLSALGSWHIQGPCCYDTMHVFASTTTSTESLSNLGIPSKSWRFGKILKMLQQKQKQKILGWLVSFFDVTRLQNGLEEYRNTSCCLHIFQNKMMPFNSKKGFLDYWKS